MYHDYTDHDLNVMNTYYYHVIKLHLMVKCKNTII